MDCSIDGKIVSTKTGVEAFIKLVLSTAKKHELIPSTEFRQRKIIRLKNAEHNDEANYIAMIEDAKKFS